MCHNGTQPTARLKQSGSALLVSLIILLLMTILGVTSMQTTTMQDRMAGNMKDRNLAFQRAEQALREAQRDLPGSVDAAISGFSVTDAEGWIKYFEDQGAFSSDKRYATHVQEIPYSVPQICEPGNVCDEGFDTVQNRILYRITALGIGQSDDTLVVLQATVTQGS